MRDLGVRKRVWGRLREALSKTRRGIEGAVREGGENLENLEAALIQADIGVKTTLRIVERVRNKIGRRIPEENALYAAVKEELLKVFKERDRSLNLSPSGLTVIMTVGVNGVGKTTTIAKLGYRLKREGKKILFAACDTFRAAAIEQLEVWGERIGVGVVKHQYGGDPAAVAFDALKAAQARGMDILIIDTAGRLHTKVNLMGELEKMKRVMENKFLSPPQEILLVLDATTGHNAISQAKLFQESLQITGIALVKLDGTAKGGIVVTIEEELGIPVKLIGIGEELEDLGDFSPQEFVEALFAP